MEKYINRLIFHDVSEKKELNKVKRSFTLFHTIVVCQSINMSLFNLSCPKQQSEPDQENS